VAESQKAARLRVASPAGVRPKAIAHATYLFTTCIMRRHKPPIETAQLRRLILMHLTKLHPSKW
jgi:hypothetical protein